MRSQLFTTFAFAVCAASVSAQELSHFQTLFDEDSVETRTLMIQLDPVNDDVRFAVTLRDKETGTVRRHEFDGEGTNDPAPFQLEEAYLCDTPVILLTVQYPWHHALPEFVRALDTFAFHRTDFALIDVAFGPLTDIALADDTAYESSDLEMLPPIGVRCLTGQGGKPFEFFEQATK
ncbi:MAG: hypothetical protein LBE86_01405 [Gemmobacter sp.]|jgi:hypothetical protein|nr:hypothetical protein [Gemmobacter sp.]